MTDDRYGEFVAVCLRLIDSPPTDDDPLRPPDRDLLRVGLESVLVGHHPEQCVIRLADRIHHERPRLARIDAECSMADLDDRLRRQFLENREQSLFSDDATAIARRIWDGIHGASDAGLVALAVRPALLMEVDQALDDTQDPHATRRTPPPFWLWLRTDPRFSSRDYRSMLEVVSEEFRGPPGDDDPDGH